MITYKEIFVDDVKYMVSKYHTPDSLRIFAIFSKLIGKPIAILTGQGLDAEAKKGLIAEAIDAFTEKVDPENFDKIIKDALKTTTIFKDGTNRQINFNTDFQGRTFHLLKLLKEILMFQYSDFLEEFGTIIPATVPTKAPEAGRIQAL